MNYFQYLHHYYYLEGHTDLYYVGWKDDEHTYNIRTNGEKTFERWIMEPQLYTGNNPVISVDDFIFTPDFKDVI